MPHVCECDRQFRPGERGVYIGRSHVDGFQRRQSGTGRYDDRCIGDLQQHLTHRFGKHVVLDERQRLTLGPRYVNYGIKGNAIGQGISGVPADQRDLAKKLERLTLTGRDAVQSGVEHDRL